MGERLPRFNIAGCSGHRNSSPGNYTNLSNMNHVGIIPDGNRRYALRNKIEFIEGYFKGMDKIGEISNYFFNKGVKYVSVYALSMENFTGRSEIELDTLLSVMGEFTNRVISGYYQIPASIKFVGRTLILPERMRRDIKKLEDFTKGKPNTLFIAVAYGGRHEVVDAVLKYINDELASFFDAPLNTVVDKLEKIVHLDINETNLAKYLYADYQKVPYPDLIIRTGHAHRLSNFMLYEAAYSELYFLDMMWPEVTTKDIDNILEDYARVKHNIGK